MGEKWILVTLARNGILSNSSCLVAKRLLIAIAKDATELRIAPNWHPKAMGRIAV